MGFESATPGVPSDDHTVINAAIQATLNTPGLRPHGGTPVAAMFEDLSRNLAVPAALGMRTILVVPGDTREVFHEDWEAEGRDEPHVQFVTDDLSGFLDAVLDAIAVPGG